jgi:hypothetical protein
LMRPRPPRQKSESDGWAENSACTWPPRSAGFS